MITCKHCKMVFKGLDVEINADGKFVCPFCHKSGFKLINHVLKIQSKYFYSILTGDKTFEVRKLDRDYKIGDVIQFNVIQQDGTTETPPYLYRIRYILTHDDFPDGIKEGYGILGIDLINNIGVLND